MLVSYWLENFLWYNASILVWSVGTVVKQLLNVWEFNSCFSYVDELNNDIEKMWTLFAISKAF